MKQDKSQSALYRIRLQYLFSQIGIISDMELSRALAELAFQIHPEAAVIAVQQFELRRVK